MKQDEIESRVHNLKKKMVDEGLDSVLLTHLPDIFYFSGSFQTGHLFIHCDHNPVLFREYPSSEMKNLKCPVDEISISSLKDLPQKIKHIQTHLPKKCGIAYDVVPMSDFLFYQQLFDATSFIDCSDSICECKKIKSNWEIEQIKQAACVSEKVFSYISDHLRPGISEMEFCGEYEAFARNLGHSGTLKSRHYRSVVYPFHLLSGDSGGVPGAVDTPCSGTGTSIAHPSGAGPKIIKKNEPILVDFGTILNGYHMDETRMFAIGSMPEKAMDASKLAIDILNSLLVEMKPGVVMKNLYEKSVKMAEQYGYADQFLGLPGIKSSFVGHSIGVELVEAPYIAKGKEEEIEPNMVFSIEPKFIFQNEFAAGVESVIQITENGTNILSLTPQKVFVV